MMTPRAPRRPRPWGRAPVMAAAMLTYLRWDGLTSPAALATLTPGMRAAVVEQLTRCMRALLTR